MGIKCLLEINETWNSTSQSPGTYGSTSSDEKDRNWICAAAATTPISPSDRMQKCTAAAALLDATSTYDSWVMKHPSALSKFEGMMKEAKGKRIVVFLDYDGTLSPIVDDPNKAFMSDAMRAAVREVAMYFPTAIISGRCRDKVYEFVQLKDVYYAGSHGMDIVTPVGPHLKMMTQLDVKYQTSNAIQHKMENDIILFQPAQEYLPAIQEIVKVLEEKTKRIHGAMVENNRFCISVHFRRVREEDYCKLEEQVKSVVKDKPQFRITRGRKVIEIRPSIKWDKGHALEYLLHNLGFGFGSSSSSSRSSSSSLLSDDQVLPFYIGDDQTDEDAFKILRSRKQGYPIIVSSIPKDTNASYSLRDPSEVMSFLLRLARWRRRSTSSSSSSSC